MSKTIQYTLTFLAVTLLLATCKKNNSDTSLLTLNIRNSFGSDSLVMGKSYRSLTGDSLSFSRVDYYLSNIQLTNTAGTIISIPGIVLVTPTTTQNIYIGGVPADTYKSIAFYVGVANADANSGGVDASMLFTNGGHIHLALEGKADSTNTSLTPNKAFSYHIGNDSLLRTISLPDHSVAPYTAYTAAGGKVMTVNLVADLSQLFKNVNVPASPVSNTTDYPVVADTIASHLQAAFKYAN